jgi:tRNA (uracil-5-)-methyltransferase TRM9
MDSKTRTALGEINRAFYDTEARAFSDTRDHPWPGWTRLLPRMRSSEPLRVLDLGCGNARFARFLSAEHVASEYLGVDASEALLELAGAAAPESQLVRHDLIRNSPAQLPPGPFDWITLFGVTHHIPGEAERRQLFLALCDRLAPDGHLVFTTWQFSSDDRFARRSLPFDDEIIDPTQLEHGDHLLQWGADTSASRYCHDTNPDERARLLAALPMRLVDEYQSDGRGDQLNHYTVLMKG